MTLKMMLLTAIIGIAVWAFLDYTQTRTLTNIFHGKLATRFGQQAQEDRIRFDRYVKAHHQAVKLFASHRRLFDYVAQKTWSARGKNEIKIHSHTPPWLPPSSVTRDFIQLRYVLLLGPQGKVKEIYQTQKQPPPQSLFEPTPLLITLSQNQSYLTTLNSQAFLLASENILGPADKHRGTLILATPLDTEFLVASQGPANSGNIVALLIGEDQPRILVSSDPQQIPVGSSLEVLRQGFLVTGRAFFDYGASDLTIKLASFMSTKEVALLTETVRNEERRERVVTAIVFIVVFSLVIFWITQRIQRLTQRVAEFSGEMGLLALAYEEQHGDQIDTLEERFQRLTEEIITETAALEYQASHDYLTQLPNRLMLNDCLDKITRENRGDKPSATLLIMDLDGFKEINDTLGHHIGDILLKQVGKRISGALGEQDTAARLGGDEFAILLPTGDEENAKQVARNLLNTIEQPFVVDGYNLSIGVSIGIALYPVHGSDRNLLMQRADVAMYNAKRLKSGLAFYDPTQDHHSIGRLALMGELRQAIENGDLELHYQPKIDMQTGVFTGVEALSRWHHPNRGFVPPDEFMPLAEQTGLITPLTTLVLQQALHQCTDWNRNGWDLSIAVNLSVRSLHDAGLANQVAAALEDAELSPHRLTLEITESAIMVDTESVQHTLTKLHALGVQFAIDDFGTGHSSLAYLKQLPVHELKIDKSFVTDMVKDENDAVIVRTTIDLAHNLGLKVVAEGVESWDAWSMLETLGCDMGQGYYISAALSPEDLLRWSQQSDWVINNLPIASG